MTDAAESDHRQDRVRTTIEHAARTSAEALARISTVREAVARISAEAAAMSGLVGEIDALSEEADPRSRLQQAGAAADAGAGALDSMNTWELQTLLEMSERRALKMKFISMMVKTDAATASRRNEQTSGFADDLERLVATVRETTRAATKAAQPIPRKVKSAQNTLKGTSDILRRKSDDLARQKRAADGLLAARDRDMADFNAEAQAISQASGRQISRLIPILQFSDAFTQRLENTKRFLDDSALRDSGGRAHACNLAARQLDSLALDSRHERTAAADAVDRLFEASMRSYQVMLANRDNDAVRRWVEASADMVAMTAGAIEVSSRRFGGAFERVDDAYEATRNVTRTIREFDDLVHILHIEALNGAIAASHSDNTRSAAYVLAAEVRVAAGECADILGACMKELTRIEATLSRLDRAAIEAEVTALAEALTGARDMQRRQGENMAAQNGSRQRLAASLQDVLEACRAARQTFRSSEAMERALEDLAASLRAEGSDDLDPDAVAWIWPYYTTQRERALHTEIAGAVAVVGAMPAGDAADADGEDGEDGDELDGFLL